jgi:hypothetical protein
LLACQVIAGWQSYAANISITGPVGIGAPNYIARTAATAAFWGIGFQVFEREEKGEKRGKRREAKRGKKR